MPRKNILWLCSWYPGKVEPFSGDFIQRHARAASLMNNISVIHVQGAEEGSSSFNASSDYPGLSERIVYTREIKTGLFRKIRNNISVLNSWKSAIRKHIAENGVPDLVHVHVPMKAGLAALWMKKKYKTKFLVTEHWGIYNSIIEDRFSNRSFLFKAATRRILREAEAFISVSRYLGEAVNAEVSKIPFRVIPNAVDTSTFYPGKPGINPFVFLHVSNMVRLKNPQGIIDAFARFTSTGGKGLLMMVGDKDPALREYAAIHTSAASNIVFTGEVSYEEVAENMRAASCLVLFSNMENSPCVIGEALCCGLPVIATNVGGIPELVDQDNSILVNAGDVDALVKAMHAMAGGQSGYRTGRIAEIAAGKFNFQAVSEKFNEVYTAIAG